jgi:hypothetical protein
MLAATLVLAMAPASAYAQGDAPKLRAGGQVRVIADDARLSVPRGDDVPLSKGKRLFVLEVGTDRVLVQHEVEGKAVPGWLPAADVEPLADKALAFDGASSKVEAPSVAFDELDAFTIEAWVYNWQGAVACQGRAGDPENSVWISLGTRADVGAPHESCGWESGRGANVEAAVGFGNKDEWNHVAMVFDGTRQRVFLNGKPIRSRRAAKPGPLNLERPFILGAHHYAESLSFGTGLLRSLRITSRARYRGEFGPLPILEADEGTIVLYDAMDAEGDELRDGSGNMRHGRMVDVKLVDSP